MIENILAIIVLIVILFIIYVALQVFIYTFLNKYMTDEEIKKYYEDVHARSFNPMDKDNINGRWFDPLL